MATRQTITKESAWAWVTSSGIWDIAKYARWDTYAALATSVALKLRVVYWCAWHWGLLIALHADLKRAQQEFYITPEDIIVDKDTGAVISAPEFGTEFASSERQRGKPTRHAQVSKFWFENRLTGFPEGSA